MRIERQRHVILGVVLLLSSGCPGFRGRLANPAFENDRIKTTLFFAGQARDGVRYYDCSPESNLESYTVKPLDTRHLTWSADVRSRDVAVNAMVGAGVNVVTMSSWGESFLPCGIGWSREAPMQTAPEAQDQLFDAAANKHLLVMPLIESRGDPAKPAPGDWRFRDEFPRGWDPVTRREAVAPGTVSQIVDLINRYLKNAKHPERAKTWARVYDGRGEARYAVAIIQVSSNSLDPNDGGAPEKFAQGFDAIADEVAARTNGVKVGFFIDPLPPDTNAPGRYRPTPDGAGPFLFNTVSILGISAYLPEVWRGTEDLRRLIEWKRDFSRGWFDTNLPFLMDVAPGYDNRIVFPRHILIFGFNDSWMNAQSEMVRDFGRNGVSFNFWNGYTEGVAAVPMRRNFDDDSCCGSVFYEWFQNMNR